MSALQPQHVLHTHTLSMQPHIYRPIIRVWSSDTGMGGGGEEMDRQKREEGKIQGGGCTDTSLAPWMERYGNRGI